MGIINEHTGLWKVYNFLMFKPSHNICYSKSPTIEEKKCGILFLQPEDGVPIFLEPYNKETDCSGRSYS
jgi:hypothetical protein